MPCVSVIVVNHNGRTLLDKCLSSIMKTTYPDLKVIMVDNAFEDDSVDYVSKAFPSVKVESCETNLGYAGGCNKGARIAKGDYLAFMNNDVKVSEDWLEPLIEVCSGLSVAVCGGKIMVSESSNPIFSAGSALNLFSAPIDRGFFEVDE